VGDRPLSPPYPRPNLDPMDEDLERPALPMWVWVIGAILLVLAAFTVVGWIMRALFALVRLGIFVALVVGAVYLLRNAFTRRD
jgi:hypothetical protein